MRGRDVSSRSLAPTGTQLLEILLQFKWEEGGGRTTFLRSIGLYSVRLC